MYQSIGVVRNSAHGAGRRRSGSAHREHEAAVGEHRDRARADRQPAWSTGVIARPASLSARAMLTVSARATSRGSRSGASMVANVSPGTPATANSPDTRSGCRKASSNIVLTPIDQPISTAPVDAEVVHHRQARPRRTPRCRSGRGRPAGRSRRCRGGSRRRRGRRSRGAAAPARSRGWCRARCRARRSGRRCRPSGSLVQARRRVPSSDRTSWKTMLGPAWPAPLRSAWRDCAGAAARVRTSPGQVDWARRDRPPLRDHRALAASGRAVARRGLQHRWCGHRARCGCGRGVERRAASGREEVLHVLAARRAAGPGRWWRSSRCGGPAAGTRRARRGPGRAWRCDVRTGGSARSWRALQAGDGEWARR